MIKSHVDVFESYEPSQDTQLIKELERDIANGLFGKTVIHPRHLRIILEAYRVPADDMASAVALMGDAPAAVKGRSGRMDEVATHGVWAARTMARAAQFGVTA